MNDNVKLLYDELKDTYDLGSEDDFRSYLSDSNKREALRKELESDYEVGDSTSFSNYLGFGSEETAETPDQPANNFVQPEIEAQRQKSMLTPGTDEWRSRTVDVPGENPYNGQTYGAVYDSIISDFGKNIAHPDVDPYAEARAQIIQAGITDDMNPDEADNLALQIREGYANRYAGNNAKEMVSSLPDQVPDIDSMMDGLWYNRDLQGRIDHEARRLGLSRDNYINYFMKPQLAKALSDRYGYDVNSAQHIAGRLLSQEDHTMERVRQNEATAMIGQYAAPYIQNHFAQALSDADKVFQKESSGSMMTPYGNAGQMAGAAIRHWQATDPEKVWEQIKPEIGRMTSDILDNPEFIKEAEAHADEEGTDVNSWLFSRIVPNLASQIQSQFEQMAIEREMPKNTMEYLWANIQNSLIGTVGRIALESQARRRMKAEALQRTEAGQNPNYTPSFGAKVGGGFLAMAPDMMLPMGGPFGLISKISTKPVQGMSQALIADGMRPLLARMAQSSGSGMLSLGAFEGVKGGVEGAFNGTEQGDNLNSRRSADDILMDTVKGIWEKGIPSGFAGSAMIGGPIGQKISNGRGAIANALGWGAQVGVDAAGATALNVIPRIAKGDITPEEIGKDFASNVGTFAALGLHSKAKEFASLADGGRAWNGVPFTKEEVRLLEDNYLGTFRKQIEEIEKSQKSINPVVERMAGIDPQERKRMLTENVGLMMYNDLMHNYAIPRETKVKVAQALGVDIPEYAAKPAVLDLMDSVRDKTTEVGLIDAMNFDYNKEGGVADKMKHGKPLDSYDLMLRLLFQDNAAYNEALKKLQSGGQLTDQEKELIAVNNDRLYQLQRNYMNQEMDRITSIFEREHNMKPGELRRMLDDLSEGKPVDSNLVGEFEDMLTRYNDALDKLRQPTEETETPVSENGTGSVSVDETPVVDEVPTEDAPKVNRVVDNAEDENPATVVNGESKPAAPPVNQETTTIDNGLLVNDDTGNIIEVTLTDGSKAYLKSGDPENEYGRVRLVDAQGNPITIQDSNGYTIDRLPSQVIARDDKGNLMVSEVKPEAPAIEGSKPAETKSKSPEETITEEPTPAMSRIKTDENGEPVWEESAAEDTAAALIEDQGGNKEAAEMVDEEIADLSSRLSELTKQDKGKNKKHSNMNERRKKKQEIKDIQEKLGYWNQVKNILDNEGKTEDGQAVDIQHSGGEAGRDREAGQVEIQAQGAEEKTGGGQEQQGVEGAEVDNGVSPVSDTNVAGRTSGVKPEPAPEPNAEQKVAQGTVKNNIGKQFEFMNQDGTRSEVVLNTFKDGNKVEVTRQDYDTDGNPKGDPYSQDLDLVDLGNSLVNGYMKPVLSTEERLREIYKGKLGMQNIIDVLTDAERQQLLEAVGKGDQEALHDMVNEFTESHREDLIMNERDKRNANVSRIMDGNGSREDKLRRVRKEFQGYDDAVLMLSDEAMQPTTLEEYIADLHSRQPKTGEGPLAYFSYEKDGRKVVGMQDETGHGTKSGGDTKGYAPWLAPKGKGMSLQQYAEQIHEQLPEGIKNQYSDQDVRNAILEVFGGAERPSDITTMVIKRGIIQAEQAARRMEEMWIDGVGYQKVSPDDSSFAGRLTRAKQQTNTEPSEGQKEAGNYKKGHLSFGGYDFVVENPEGSFRRGKDNSGKSWEQKMNNTYGYILGKKGKDGDHLDMFINDAQDLDNWNGKVYVVDQVDPETGKFDEHKIMYGFNSEAEARDAYLSNYEEGWQGLGRITGVDKDTFDKWLDSSDKKIKEFAEHHIIKEAVVKQPEKHEPTDAEIEKAIMYEVFKEPAEKGVEFVTDVEEGQKILDDYNGVGKLSASKKRAVETASLNPKEGSPADISTADGAKIQKKLESYANKLEKVSNLRKNFLDELAEELGATSDGSKSKYATFITKNGDKVTIRLGNHNATVSNFDYRGEDNGISIVVSRRENEGVKNDGNAHIVEAFYPEIALRKAYGKPLSEIVRSINEALNSGKYNDTTGLAEMEEVNADEIKQHKVYHGSGTEFDAFDHSHMGEGAGSQSFGYGTYVSAGQSVAEGYAHQPTYRVEKEKNQFIDASRAYGRALTALDDAKESGVAVDEAIANAEKAKNEYEEAKRIYEEARKGYLYDIEIPGENEAYYIDYKGMMGDQKDLLDMVDNALTADGWKRQEIDSRTKFTKGDKQIILTPNQSGADLYAELEDALGSDKAASEFLHKTGITGIKYPAGTIMGGGNGATNYVIFNEGDAKITGRTKFFKTPDGHAYGFTYKGKIYIDPRIATSETPIHEYGHLWAEMKRQSSPEEWNRIKEVLLNDKIIEPFIEKVKRDYPELEGKEDDFVEEVLTQFSGKHGAEKLRKMAEEIKQEMGGDATAETIAEAAVRRVKSLLNDFWKGVCDMMGWKYTNAEDIADAVLRDLLNGVNPTEKMKAASAQLKPQAEIERTLMGVHNLSEEKLRKVLKQGGLANPSLAVVDTKNHMHTDYGSISLIPKASMIDARTGRNAGTFTADAWTPTYPTVQKRMSDKGQSKFWKDIRKLNDEAGEIANHMRMAFDTWLDKEVGQERLAYWYLKEKGLNPETATFDNPYGKEVADRLDALTDDGNKDVRDLNEEEIKEVADMYHAYMERIGEPVAPAGERIKMLQARMDPGKSSPFLKLQQSRLDELEKYGELLHALNDFAYKARRAAFEAGKVDADTSMRKAQETLKQQGLQQDFDKWLQDKADSYGIEEWLYSGTDDRTGEQKWVRNTLQNASRLMKKEGLNGAVGWSSLGNWIATVANKEKTLGGIRKYRKNLATTEEQHDAWKENWGNRLYPIVEKLGNGDVFNGDNVMADILEHKDYAGYYKREYGKELSKEDRATIDEFIKEVRTNFPTGYFETKFERPVMLDEFEIAVVPESTSPDIVEALKNAGLDVRTYDNTGTEDQRDANRKQATMEAVQGRDDIMFQMVGKEGAAEADRAEGNDERSRNLTLAEDSEKAGVDAKAIKLATGWERGADGQWRYEIPDADVDVLSKYRAKADEMKKDGVAKPQPIIKLGELLGEDNELFRYYPDLKKTDVLFSDTLPDGTAGSFDGSNIEINSKEVNRFNGDDLNNESVYGTLLHEVQHAIQDIEGFARGGNLHTSTTETGINAIIAKKEAERARIKTELDAINKILSSSPEEKKDYADLVGRTVGDYMFHLEMEAANLAQKSDNIKSYIEKIKRDNAPSMTDAKDLYHRLAGEVEARNVTSRMALNDIGKRQTLATVTEDVPREDQVIIHNEGSESASIVDDKETIDRLEKEPKVKVYRAMQLIDGKLYPPMAAKRDGKLVEPIELGKWEQADEHPELADENGKFKLDKGNGKSLKAAYNPYIHTSTTMLNDQFSEAQNRDNLIVVEVEVPESELTSGYKADKAKDAVGKLEWKAGVIQGQLSGTREVILSRWDKPIRIVPTEEVAQHIADMIKGKVEVMPTNVVTPQQRAELEKLGVKFVETDNQGKILDGENAGKTYSSVYGKKIQEKTPVNPMSEDFPKFSKVRKPSPRQLNEEIRKEKEVRRIEVAKKRAADEGGIKEPNRASFEREASKRYRNDLNEWMVRHGLTGYRPTEEGPELDKWKAAETDREDPKPNIFDYTGEKEYREAYADYLEKIEKYKPEETAELTKDDLIVEREMQTRTPAQKIINGISTTLARDFNGEQASDAVREGILGRRKNIEDLSADDSIYINNLVQQTDRLAKEMSGDHWDGEDTFSRIMNEVERRKRGMDHISGKDIRDALPFLIEAPMRRRDIAHDINDELQQKGSPARVSGEDIKAARMPISELRDEAMRLLEINKMMANDGRTQMTSEEQSVYDRVKAGAQNVADAINAAADHQSVPLTSDDVLASLSNFIKRDVPANLKVTEDMPELQGIIGSIRDWYRTAYTWLDDAGMRRENIGYYEHYVNHVWDAKRSDAEAYDTLVANRQPTTSRNMRERQVRTYMEGIEAGLVPQFSDIADMMGDYSKKNILAWANKKMLSDLSFIDVVERNDDGEVTAIFPMMSSKAPVLYDLNKYKYYEVPGVGPLWVYKDAADNFSQIFEQYDVSNGMKIYDNMASLAKKIELSWSGFHAGALTEVYAVQNAIEFGPKKTAQYFYKYLIKDCLESGLSPAYANPEDYRSAARHYVKLGATDDYSAPAVQNMSDTMVRFINETRQALKNKGLLGKASAEGLKPIEIMATAVKLINEGSDKILWTWLHDGLKIATFKMMEERSRSTMDARFLKQHPDMSLDEIHKSKEYIDALDKQLDRDGQYVNDQYGGQHWELINISPKMLRRMRRFLLSPDWLVSTQRHFLGAFGYGDIHSKARLRDFNKFLKAVKGEKVEFDPESLPGLYAGLLGRTGKAVGIDNSWADIDLPKGRTRRMLSSILCYAIGVNIFYDIANNIVNAIMRNLDEQDELEKEKQQDGYVSKYKLMYPDGMKWFDRKRLDWNPMHMFGITNMIFGDYGMQGNALGKKTHVFGGHYDEGAEAYLRTGKQFKEFPDFWENEKGELEFPRPLINRLMGKANPNIRMLYNTLNYYTRWDKSYDDKQLEERIKDISDNKTFIGVSAGLTKLGENYKPFWVPTQDGKDWIPTDMVFPSSKGFSAHKAREYFEQFMRAGDEEGYMETVKACIMNGMTDEQIKKASDSARKAIESEQIKKDTEGSETLQEVMNRFDATKNLAARNRLYKKIYTELGNEEPKTPKTYEDFQEWFQDYMDGVDSDDLKTNEKYMERAKATDMAEEARVSQLTKQCKAIVHEINVMKEDGISADSIKAFSEQPENKRLLDAWQIVNKYKNDRKKEPGYDHWKKDLGKDPEKGPDGKTHDDKWRMAKIRGMRKEMLTQIERLGD